LKLCVISATASNSRLTAEQVIYLYHEGIKHDKLSISLKTVDAQLFNFALPPGVARETNGRSVASLEGVVAGGCVAG